MGSSASVGGGVSGFFKSIFGRCECMGAAWAGSRVERGTPGGGVSDILIHPLPPAPLTWHYTPLPPARLNATAPSTGIALKSGPSKSTTARSLGSDGGGDGNGVASAPSGGGGGAGQVRVSTSSANGSAFSFSVNVNATREAPTPSPGSALTPKVAGAGAAATARSAAGAGSKGKLVSEEGTGALPPQSVARAAPAPVAVDGGQRKGGFFSFLGC